MKNMKFTKKEYEIAKKMLKFHDSLRQAGNLISFRQWLYLDTKKIDVTASNDNCYKFIKINK